MLNLNYIPIHFSFALIIGIILGYYFDFSLKIIFCSTLLIFIGLVYFFFKAEKSFHPPFVFVLFASILFILIGTISIHFAKPKNQVNHYLNFLGKDNTSGIRINKILKSNSYYQKFEGEVIQLNNKATKGTVLVNIESKSLFKEVIVDDIIITSTDYLEVRGALNPFEFNYQEYLKKQNIHHQISLKNEMFVLLQNQPKTLFGIAHGFREKINIELKGQNFSEDELSIFNAILLGQRRDVSKETFEIYKNAGAIHILAVSGLHIGIILLLINFLFSPLEILKNGKLIKLIFVLIFLWLYAFIAGLSPSVIRAVAMFTAIAIGIALNRPSGVKNSLVVSLFFLLLIHPLFLFDVGFQLSYIAVFSIVWLQPIMSKVWVPKCKLANYFWQLLTVSFAAQLGILPLSLYYFHQFPGLFFVSSLVIIPFLGFILGIGFLVIILAVWNLLPKFLVYFYEIVIKTLNTVVDIISQQETFLFENISFSLLLLIASYGLLICTINLVQNKNATNVFAFLIAIIFLQISLFFEKAEKYKKNEFIVFQQNEKSIFIHRIKNKVILYKNLTDSSNTLPQQVNTYLMANNNLKIQEQNSIKNHLKINNKSVLVIDSLGIYYPLKINPEIVILTQSPKINMQRVIEIYQPKIVIVDGTNFKSYTKRWENTCKSQSIQFYSTSDKGAFVSVY